jgi:hypothetical protein
VTANAGQTKVYGSSDPTFTYQSTGLLGGDSFSGALSRAAGENVAGGPYAINQGTLTAGSNYSITFNGDTFAITPYGVTVTANAGQTKVYGSADPALTYQSTGLLGGDSFSGALARAAGENVAGGPYAINQGNLTAGSNYSITFNGDTFAITPYGVTVTANAGQSKVYGSADPAFTYQSTGLLGGDSFSGALARAAGENVAGGPYAINQGTLTAGSNYAITFNGDSFSITPYGVTVTANAGQSKVYGSSDPTFTYQSTGLLGGDSFSGALSRAAGENVAGGPYAINQGTLTAGSNYSMTFNGDNFSITPYGVTVTANAGQTKVYGSSDPTFTYQSTGLLGGDSFSGTLSRAAGENVAGGPYAINQGSLTAGSNYSITFNGNNFSITPYGVTVTANAGQTKVYGSSDPTFAYQSTGLLGGDSFSGALGRAAGETVAGGPYAINQGTLTAGSNYSITFNGDTFAITPYGVTVTANAGQTKVYGSADPALTYQSTGLLGGDSFSGALARAAGENVAGGPYAINQGNLTAGSNYSITFNGDTFAITPYGVTVTANAGQSKVYGSADPAFTYQSTGLLGGDSFSGALARAAGENVAGGPYAINQGTLTAGSNYAITFNGDSFSITPYGVTVTANAGQSKVYGSSDPTFTYQSTGLLGGDSFSGALSRAAGENVAGGPYAINQGTLTAGSNYSMTFNGDNFSITPYGVTVTANAGQTKVYGSSDPTFTYQSTGLLGGDSFSGTLSRAAGENVAGGPYAINQGSLTAGSNYSITFNGDNFSITPYGVTVTANAGQSKVYGSADPAFTYQSTGLLGGDSFSGALARAAGENVAGGPYAINQGSLTAGSNYSITFNGDNFSITPYGVTVTANAGQTKVYGSADPAFTYQSTGLLGGDSFSGALARAAGENVAGGPYAINQGTLDAGANYSLTFLGGTFSITARPITVTADAQTKVYGDSDPTLTYQITSGSLVGSDSFSGSLSRVAGKNVGSYAIGQNTLTAGSNYALSYIGANLSITAKAITLSGITASNKVYDATRDAAISMALATFVGKIAGDDLTVSSTGTFSNKNVGNNKTVTLTNTLGGADLGNYQITEQSATTANITAKDLTVTASGVNKTFDDTVQATVNLSDNRVAGDALNDTYTSAVFDTKDIGENKTVAVSGIAISGADAPNYNLMNTTASTTASISAVVPVTPVTPSETENAAIDRTISSIDTTITTVGSGVGSDTGLVTGLVTTPPTTGGTSGGTNTGTGNVTGGMDAGTFFTTGTGTGTGSIDMSGIMNLGGIEVGNVIMPVVTTPVVPTTTPTVVTNPVVTTSTPVVTTTTPVVTTSTPVVTTTTPVVTNPVTTPTASNTATGTVSNTATPSTSAQTQTPAATETVAPTQSGTTTPPTSSEPAASSAKEEKSTSSESSAVNEKEASVTDDSAPKSQEKKVAKEESEEREVSVEDNAETPANSTASSEDKAVNWRDIPIWEFFGKEETKKFLTDVRVLEGAVYVLDGSNAMSLLGMGDSLRVLYKKRKANLSGLKPRVQDLPMRDQGPKQSALEKTLEVMNHADDKNKVQDVQVPEVPSSGPVVQQALEKILQKSAEEPEATPAPEQQVRKSALPIVMQETESGMRYGTLKNPGKDVFVKSPDGEWKSAKDGMVILPGDEVKTAPQSSVDVLMDGGATGRIEIKEGSLFRIQKAETDATTGDKSTIIDLALGKILVKVESIKGNGKFEVRTPTALTGVRGTIFEVSVKEKS